MLTMCQTLCCTWTILFHLPDKAVRYYHSFYRWRHWGWSHLPKVNVWVMDLGYCSFKSHIPQCHLSFGPPDTVLGTRHFPAHKCTCWVKECAHFHHKRETWEKVVFRFESEDRERANALVQRLLGRKNPLLLSVLFRPSSDWMNPHFDLTLVLMRADHQICYFCLLST